MEKRTFFSLGVIRWRIDLIIDLSVAEVIDEIARHAGIVVVVAVVPNKVDAKNALSLGLLVLGLIYIIGLTKPPSRRPLERLSTTQ